MVTEMTLFNPVMENALRGKRAKFAEVDKVKAPSITRSDPVTEMEVILAAFALTVTSSTFANPTNAIVPRVARPELAPLSRSKSLLIVQEVPAR